MPPVRPKRVLTQKQITKANLSRKAVNDVAIADINSDGSLEFTLGNAVYNYDIGALFEIGEGWSPSSIIFDSNNDGAQEVLTRGKLHDLYGIEFWDYIGESDVWFSSIADIDSDGQPEIILSIPSGASTPEKSRIVALDTLKTGKMHESCYKMLIRRCMKPKIVAEIA